jgi:hypothetical protein
MNNRERFLAVARFEKPDYFPIFGFPGAPGMSGGALKTTHDWLLAQGLPSRVGGVVDNWQMHDLASWHKYWGTCSPLHLDFDLARDVPGIKSTTRIENGFEVVEYETGAIDRQVINNANEYSMPEFVRYSVRDRKSWEFWRDRMTPRSFMPRAEMETRCRRFDNRTDPLFIGIWGAYGFIRSLMGPEGLSLAFYDNPDLVHEMIAWLINQAKLRWFPLLERLRPEAVYIGEDLCYNHGMLLSPAIFNEFCGPYYQAVCACARSAGIPVIAVDSDGNIMEFAGLAAGYGVNCLYPNEVKAGNDLFALRRKLPRLICVGWLEKEIVNEGNLDLIEGEIMRKVPPLLRQGGYFPNGDHGLQPLVSFKGLCRFMTLLHEVCGNPEGEFPRAI